MLLAVLFAALLLWPLIGPVAALGFCCAALIALYTFHRHNLRKLERWLRQPSAETLPRARGDWGASFSYLARLLRVQSQSEARLAAALDRFRQAGAAMPDGMVILDEADRIEWCNPRAENHFALDVGRDCGQQITYLVRAPLFHAYLQSQSYGEPLDLRLPHDPQLALSVQLVPFGDKQKLLISRDVTRLEKAETVRRDFIANVSHELRSPLTVVVGFLENLVDLAGMPETARRPLQLMTEQARRMQRLVDDLLTLSRLESAQNPLREEAVDVPRLARLLQQDALELSAGRHRVVLRLQSDAWLNGSEQELHSAFSNLVSNAVRYTPPGGEITLAWLDRDDGAAFEVEDTGIGIEAQHLPRLTERFYRVDRSRSRETGGTGLGLAIVKHVLNRHQGRLEIMSEPGAGSRFAAMFPAARCVAPSAGAVAAETAA